MRTSKQKKLSALCLKEEMICTGYSVQGLFSLLLCCTFMKIPIYETPYFAFSIYYADQFYTRKHALYFAYVPQSWFCAWERGINDIRKNERKSKISYNQFF